MFKLEYKYAIHISTVNNQKHTIAVQKCTTGYKFVFIGDNMYQNWDDLRYFLAVSRTNSFAGAAARLHVTHSTVARRITAMEESLNTTLLIRTEKGCRLTPAGEELLPYAEELETTIMNLEEQVHGEDSQLSGTVKIGAPDGLGNCFLTRHLGEFQRQHPKLEIELMPVPMYYSLHKREVDILISITKPTSGNIVSRKISNYRLGLFASEEYLATHDKISSKSDLNGHTMVDYIEDLLYDDDLRFLNELSPGTKADFRISTVIGQMNAVLSGAGVGVIPYFMAYNEPDLVPVLPELSIERRFWLQVNPDSRQLARVRTTIDFIINSIESDKDIFLSLP